MVSLSSPSTPDPPATASRSRSHLVDTIFSYDGNVMLAAIISLLLVILFVLLLHFYAKCFLSSSPSRRRRLRPPPSSTVLSARLQMLTRDTALLSPSPPCPASKGLDPSTISSIPLFVARPGGGGEKDEECVVCLGGFEENDVGRRLPECGHGFHVDCIDTWLRSCASCPICREPVVANTCKETKNKDKLAVAEDANSDDSAQETRDTTVQDDMGSSLTEIAIDIVHDDGGNDNVGSPSALQLQPSSSARAQQSSTSLGCSLKRMLSRNRAESKIHPSSASSPPSSVNINEPESNTSR